MNPWSDAQFAATIAAAEQAEQAAMRPTSRARRSARPLRPVAAMRHHRAWQAGYQPPVPWVTGADGVTFWTAADWAAHPQTKSRAARPVVFLEHVPAPRPREHTPMSRHWVGWMLAVYAVLCYVAPPAVSGWYALVMLAAFLRAALTSGR